MKILITGGAGYIGSHTILEALRNNHEVIAVDNLERGYQEALNRVEKLSGKSFIFEKVDLRNFEEIDNVIEKTLPDVIIHFAAYKNVGESEQKPEMYYENNVHATENLLQAMAKHGTKRIIFSSTSAVYGMAEKMPITEQTPLNPMSVYGKSKLEMEKLIRSYSEKYNFEALAFRYFNAVGADESGEIGEDPSLSLNLIPVVMQVLMGNREEVLLFGNQFNTKDGTQERDYIHVSDLADAHIKATQIPIQKGEMIISNLSTGSSTSCMEIFKLCEEVSQKKLKFRVVEPRQGDPVITIADNTFATNLLGWTPKRDIKRSIKDQWNWTIKNPTGY